MMSIDYTHCLRPHFTENVLAHLLAGTSVNVVVPEIGGEASRLISDIQACDLSNVRVLAVNMQTCRANYQQFLWDLWHQYDQQLPPTDLLNFLTTLAQGKQQFLLILNHFQAMSADEVDEQYNQDFYIQLNNIKNDRQVGLLMITHDTDYQRMLFKLVGAFKRTQLDIQAIEDLPPLTKDEARYELTRRHPELDNAYISDLLRQTQHPTLNYNYTLLDYLSHQFKHSAQTWDDKAGFIRQVKNWARQHHKQQAKQINYYAQKTIGGKKNTLIFKIKQFVKLFNNGFKKN